ncbi:hypothetical protein MKX03_013800, partial [Papaver bracteatum]
EGYLGFQMDRFRLKELRHAHKFFIKWKENLFLGYVQVYPDKGRVAFSAGLHGWGFSLTNFANMYASKFGVDNFFDPATKRWTTKRTSSATCKRGFVHKLWPMLQKLGVTMKNDEKDLILNPLMKRVMLTWVPAATALLEMMIFHLCSPSKDQRYSVKNLYVGPLDDQYANAIRNCDPEGLLMLYLCAKVRIMGVSRELWMGRKQESVEDVPCGNTIATLTNKKEVDAHPIRAMKFYVSPVLVEELTRLPNSDPVVVCTIKELSEHFIAGLAGRFHGWCDIVKSYPVVSFCETVIEKSSETVMSQSPNKHNRLYLEAHPFECGLAEAIDDGRIGPRDDPTGKDLAKKIWCFGPDTTGPNMVVDMCEGVQYLNEIKESVVAGSQWASKEGVLAEENMRGICFEVCDVVLHSDAIHRDGGQNALGGIYGVLNQKRGHVFEEMQRPGTPLYNMKAYLLVVESFGFSAQLRLATSGEAFPQSVFDHWDPMMADLLQPGTQAAHLATDIRKRKSLKAQM